jgi:hypothetical protein
MKQNATISGWLLEWPPYSNFRRVTGVHEVE